ncbi:restriction endonuclease [Streptomyces tsukubensis]|uniref:restriction endonuclease n=1 Tax=Streptomyces tsukubensis TaxID=83656 RepID=UPI0036956030
MITEGSPENSRRSRGERRRWQEYEQEVAALVDSLDPGSVVQHNRLALGRISGVQRQLDAVVEGHIAGQHLSIVIEAKLHRRRVSIGVVDEFIGKMLDVGSDRGVLYAAGGFTDGALSRASNARNPGVGCVHLDPDAESTTGVHHEYVLGRVTGPAPLLGRGLSASHLDLVLGYNRTDSYREWGSRKNVTLYRQYRD